MKHSNEENARREALVRDIMRVYKRVRDDETRLRSPQSIMPTIVAILRSGVTADAPADTNALRMSPAQQWLIGIAWILRELGQVSAFILEMRLTRRPEAPKRRMRRSRLILRLAVWSPPRMVCRSREKPYECCTSALATRSFICWRSAG